MRIRHGGAWSVSRGHAFAVLGLDGTGALHPARLRGVIRIERGGVWIGARRGSGVERADRVCDALDLIVGKLGVHR